MDSAVERRLGASGMRAQEQIVSATRRQGAQAGQQRDPNGLQAYAGRVPWGRHWGGSGSCAGGERRGRDRRTSGTPPRASGTTPEESPTSLDDFERHPLLFGPSPIHPLDRLSERLDGARIWAKREDCNSGLAYGGNTTRKLEYLVPDALRKGADTLVSIGGVQSNHTRQVAAASPAPPRRA